MDIFWHKFICSILLFISACLGYVFPVHIQRRNYSDEPGKSNKRKQILPILASFGAGAFIALAIVHLIPEAIEESSSGSGSLVFTIAGTKVNGVCYFILLGFLISLLCESISDEVFGGHQSKHSNERNTNGELNNHNINSNIISTNVSSECTSDDESYIINTNENVKVTNKNKVINNEKNIEDTSINYNETKIRKNKTRSNLNSLYIGFVLVSALFLHSLFEGMIVGTSKTIIGTWLITAVIFAHKWIETLIVFVTLTSKGVNPFAFILLLSISSPLGSLLGAIVTLTSSTISSVYTALAAGTILYVSCIEVIPEVFNKKRDISIFTKLFSFVTGIVVVSALTLVGDVVENSI
ncbi:hypothetical protein FG386_000914 [Cryptosporidium ryanae]|uniref:uncharacterized protein n=1 Tax=Cryptosporidium ryanae TaxID=515981 RepID=UPI00351A5331|nr:hypothetical protein FG386_000914 [Cryptosporidium ryanae]